MVVSSSLAKSSCNDSTTILAFASISCGVMPHPDDTLGFSAFGGSNISNQFLPTAAPVCGALSLSVPSVPVTKRHSCADNPTAQTRCHAALRPELLGPEWCNIINRRFVGRTCRQPAVLRGANGCRLQPPSAAFHQGPPEIAAVSPDTPEALPKAMRSLRVRIGWSDRPAIVGAPTGSGAGQFCYKKTIDAAFRQPWVGRPLR